MTNTALTRIGHICEVTSGQSAPQGSEFFGNLGNPFVRAGSLESLVNCETEKDCERISDEVAKEKKMRLYPKDTIVFAKSGMSAKIGRVYRLRQPCYVVSHLAALLPSKEVVPSYLQRWLEYNPPSRLIPNDAYPSIRTGEIAKLEVPLPSLTEQKRIAAILDKADALRRKRQQGIGELNNLIHAAFAEYFSDSMSNNSCQDDLANLADIVSGVTKGRKFNGKPTVMLPYIRVANVQAGYLDLSEIKDIEALPEDLEKYRLEYADILLTEGGDFDKLGRGTMWEGQIKDCIHQNHVFRVRVNRERVLPEYFDIFLQTQFAKAYFLRCAKKTSNLASINMTQLRKLPVPVPKMSLQQHFSTFYHKHNDMTKLFDKNFNEANNLFNSLIQRAFKGDL